MRKVVVTEFMSLDGVMEDPGGAEKFEHGGWTMPYWGDEIGKFIGEGMAASDAQLLGRVTYQGFAAAWPESTDEGADVMNNMPKYVVSTTLDKVTWKNSHLIKGNMAAEVSRLKRQPGKDILVSGSRTLVQSLIRENLVDEFRLLVYPVVLGSGKRLFEDGRKVDLNLLEARPLNSGVIALVYQPASSK